MEPNEGIKAWQWVVTVIVIIILIVLGYYMFRGDNNTSDVPDTNLSATSTPAADANEVNRVVVADQYPGNIAYVSSVQLANPGFVVIHKDDNGKPGAVIGSAYFEKGINPGRINLTERTVDGGIYYAVLHADINGNKVFDPATDLPLKDSKGNEIMKVFRATSNVTEVKG
ncbi:MAG: hypothetical protein Q8Q03_00950 [bacterium]|nr:hypothetical protein [bacterium]